MGKIPVTARPETLPRTSNWGSGRRILSDSPPRIRPTTGPLVVLVASAGEFDPPRLGRGKTTCGFGRHLEKRALISTVVPSPMHRFSRPIDQLESLLRIVIPNEVRDLQSRQLQVPRFFHHICPVRGSFPDRRSEACARLQRRSTHASEKHASVGCFEN